MSFDHQSLEALAGRKRFLNGQEELFDLIVDRHSGTLSTNFESAVYDFYVKDGLDTAEVAERVAHFSDEDQDVFMVTAEQRVAEALSIAYKRAGYDGAQHKDRCIDLMVRTLAGPDYRTWVKNFEDGEDGPETYSWITRDD